MYDNLCKLLIDNGGIVKPLMIDVENFSWNRFVQPINICC